MTEVHKVSMPRPGVLNDHPHRPHFDFSEDEISRRLDIALLTHTGPAFPETPALVQFLPQPHKPAAVLVPFLRQNGAWHILLTRRNPDLPEHSGQVAFPGGRSDPGDAGPEGTALREAYEEIGLAPSDVRILGHLHEFLTITNYLVTPIIGVMPWPYPLKLERQEVSRAFTIPLDWLADPANHEERLRALPAPYAPVPVIYFSPYDGEMLWGASARFTLTLLEALNKKM